MTKMSIQHLQSKFAIVSLLLGILAGVAGFVKAWVMQPWRLEAAESRLNKIEIRQEQDKHTLIRLEERLEFKKSKILELQTRLEALNRRSPVRIP